MHASLQPFRFTAAGSFGWLLPALVWLLAAPAGPVRAQTQTLALRQLTGHVPAAVKFLPSGGRLAAARRLHLALGLPLRNTASLSNLLERIYDPGSPEYRHYLTPEQFTEQFGPLPADYERISRFAREQGLTVAPPRASRLILDLEGSVATVEAALHVTLRTYQHPTEDRVFYAPDAEPTLPADLAVVEIAGLSDWALLRSGAHGRPLDQTSGIAAGSGPGGSNLGADFRRAYAPRVTLDGAGELVGLIEFDGYYANDILTYETLAGLPHVPLINVPVDGFTGPPGVANNEVALDIEMAISMAPGLAGVVVFEAPNSVANWLDLLDTMASSNQVRQFSSSWGFSGGTGPNATFDSVFQRMAAQGQSFFQASGDGDAWVNPIQTPSGSAYVTSVGGTSLALGATDGSYRGETVWNSGNLGASSAWGPNGNGYWGSGGGFTTAYAIPVWQQGISMTLNQGSGAWRNIPDVAMASDSIWVTYGNGQSGSFFGTSCAAPLWAGFCALVNQQAAANHRAPVGFINPALYAVATSTNYANCFHDILVGNNTSGVSPSRYYAVPGFDLCTGWGTPTGQSLIDALVPDGLGIVLPAPGLVAAGPVGGPFTNLNQTIFLTNRGNSPLTWSCGVADTWLKVTPASGTLASGAPAKPFGVSLTDVATQLGAGVYTANLWFTNTSDGLVQNRQAVLLVNPRSVPSTYVNALFALQPAGYWPLNETNRLPAANVIANVGTLGTVENGFPNDKALLGQGGVVSNSITFTNPGQVVGYLGSYVDIPHHPAFNTAGPFSVEFWARPGLTPGDFFCPVSSLEVLPVNGSGRPGWIFYEGAGNQWSFRMGNAAGYVATLAGGTLRTSVWQHVAAVYDGTSASLYVNGSRVAGPTAVPGYTPSVNPALPLRIGATSFGNRTFDGSVDEVACYTNALSAATIAAHYQAATTNYSGYGRQILASQPVGYWPLDEPSYSPVAAGSLPIAFNLGSLSYLVDGVYQPGCLPGVPGVPGGGLGDGNLASAFTSGAYVAIPGLLFNTTGPLTLVAWVLTPTAAGQAQTIFSRGSNSFHLAMDAQGLPHFGAGSQSFGDLVGPVRIDDNRWHQLVGGFDGINREYLYLDGQLAAASPATAVAPGASIADLWIGGSPDAGVFQFFNGAIDEVAVLTNSLSSSQVRWLYSSGFNATRLEAGFYPGTTGSLTLTWAALPGQSYFLQSSPSLSSPVWTTLGGSRLATNALMTQTGLSVTNSQQFYRVVLVP